MSTMDHCIPDELISQEKPHSIQVVPTIEEPEEDDRSIQAIALPKTPSPTSPLNGYMLFCTLVVGFGGLNWGYENALVGPVSAMRAFVAHMQGVNPETGMYVLTATNQSILFSVPLTGTVVSGKHTGETFDTDQFLPTCSLFCHRWELLLRHHFKVDLVENGH